MIKKEENRIRKENGIHTPEKRHNAYKYKSHMGRYERKVNNLGWDEYSPVTNKCWDICLVSN